MVEHGMKRNRFDFVTIAKLTNENRIANRSPKTTRSGNFPATGSLCY